MIDKNIFGKRLKELRTTSKNSQSFVAQLINVSKTQISDIENGKTATTLEKICVLADYFNVSLDYLVGRSDDRQESTRPAEYSTEKEELISIFESLDEISKGRLVERSKILLEESQKYETGKKKA